MTTVQKLISSLAVATAISLTSLASNAADIARDAPTKTVKAWDLDLTNLTDVQTLYARVQNAANDVCREEARRHWTSTRRMAPAGWTEHCVTDAVDAVVQNVGSPALAALHTREGVARND